MKTLKLVLSTLALSLLAAVAGPDGKEGKGPGGEGKGPGGKPGEAMFKRLDADSSGDISLDEFKKGPRFANDAAKAEEVYKKIDANGDGKVTLEEMKAMRPPGGGRGPGKGGKPGEGKGGEKPAEGEKK
jgi:hypothetical protein